MNHITSAAIKIARADVTVNMQATSISAVIDRAKNSNNHRLNGLAMTAGEKRCAEKAVERGLMTKHHASFPGYGPVLMYELTKGA